MTEVERAIRDIADIRAQLATSTRFRGYAPGIVAAVGLAALALTCAQIAWPGRFAQGAVQSVRLWGLLIVAGFVAVGGEAIVRTRRQNGRMAWPMVLAMSRATLPAAVMAVAIPAVVLGHDPASAWIVPGIWQMLIGLVCFASYPLMPRSIVWPGAWFVLTGVAGLTIAGQGGTLDPVMVGIPFVVGHFGIAWSLSRDA